MSIDKRISECFTKFIRENSRISEKELEKIQYGINVLLINVIKLFVLFITAYFLGVLEYTLVAFISFAALRTFACGVHAGSNIKCIIMNYIVFLGNTYLSMNITISRATAMILIFISLILILFYAPADTEERPLVSGKLRKGLKIKSIICTIFLAIVSLLIGNKEYMRLITFSVLEAALLISPIIYIVMGKKYRNYEKIQNAKGEKHLI